MLDAYIIDELKREEEAQRREEQRPQLELPLPPPDWKPEQSEEPKRGVVIIQVVRHR